MKDSLTLIALLSLMFYQNWRLAIFALFMIPFAVFISRKLGKRMKLSNDLKYSKYTEIINGKHLCSIECADDVNINIKKFIENV